MGGYGSGRNGPASGMTTEGCRSIDVRRWQRDELLTSGHNFSWQWRTCDGEVTGSIKVQVMTQAIMLTYKHKSNDSDWCAESYAVQLSWTPCTLGGRRPWFLCPARGCTRRVALLYGVGGIFACRRCYRLSYPSQLEGSADRALRRADAIRERLGWPPGIWGGHGGKPKAMHWKTYRRLTAALDRWADASTALFMQTLGHF